MKPLNLLFIFLISSTATFAQEEISKNQPVVTSYALNLKAFGATETSNLLNSFSLSQEQTLPKAALTISPHKMPVYEPAETLKMPTYAAPSSMNYKMIVVDPSTSK